MQEAELKERVEHLFASALAQTYHRDALIEFYHILRQAWSQLEQASGQDAYYSTLREVLQQIKSTNLELRQRDQLEVVDQEVIESIQYHFVQLEEDAKLR